MKTFLTVIALLGMQSAFASDGFRNTKLHCEGPSRVTDYVLVLDVDPDDGDIYIQNKDNTDPYRVTELEIKSLDETIAAKNGVTFVSGTFTDVRRVNVRSGTYDLIVGPSAANLLMKNDAGEIHDFFRLECTK